MNLPHAKVFEISHLDTSIPQSKSEMLDNFASVSIYPYANLNVPDRMTTVFLVAESEEQINESARQRLIQVCSFHGTELAEKVVPSLADIRKAWRQEYEYKQEIKRRFPEDSDRIDK